LMNLLWAKVSELVLRVVTWWVCVMNYWFQRPSNGKPYFQIIFFCAINVASLIFIFLFSQYRSSSRGSSKLRNHFWDRVWRMQWLPNCRHAIETCWDYESDWMME
jgi:hypothetical protein